MSTWNRRRLFERSREVIRANQDESGAYIACPNFPEYRYSWLRDGSFIAYAMLKSEKPDSTEAFLRWAARAIEASPIDWTALESASAAGTPPPHGAYLPTRFNLDGSRTDDDWPNFQIDGYGDWLWLLREWAAASGVHETPAWAENAVEKTIRYLRLSWTLPCHDAWEEFGDRWHPATLACVYGGFRAASAMGWETDASADAVRARVLNDGVSNGALIKSAGNEAPDAGLLWAGTPFGLVEPGGEIMSTTVSRIETELLVSGGVKRYPNDTYYGGGRWILLTAWLGWHYVRTGRSAEAEACAAWIESCVSEEGHLPEQVVGVEADEAALAHWIERWGPIAEPLLWSHAMYVVLVQELRTQAGVAGSQIHPNRGGTS